MKLPEQIFIFLQRIIPQHWLSYRMFTLMRCDIRIIKNLLIKNFIRIYQVDMGIAVKKYPEDYIHFNDFFVRELQKTARPVDEHHEALVSPVDGTVSQSGTIENGQLIQAKGHNYSLSALLANDQELSQQFAEGSFATLYLAPKDYHRIHMPLAGKLRKMIYVPGDLFAVNQATVNNVPGLFARNERCISLFDTEFGPMLMIMVGAIFVGSMQTVWEPALITPPYGKEIILQDYDGSLRLKKGQEMGRFNMGSTVIFLFCKDQVDLSVDLVPGAVLRMGQKIGQKRNVII